jgi:hypothetical protein
LLRGKIKAGSITFVCEPITLPGLTRMHYTLVALKRGMSATGDIALLSRRRAIRRDRAGLVDPLCRKPIQPWRTF